MSSDTSDNEVEEVSMATVSEEEEDEDEDSLWEEELDDDDDASMGEVEDDDDDFKSSNPLDVMINNCSRSKKVQEVQLAAAWKLPPEESHSDFQIVVKRVVGTNHNNQQQQLGDDDDDEETKESDDRDLEDVVEEKEEDVVVVVYHVHKVLLTVGPHSSRYIAAMVSKSNNNSVSFTEQTSGVCRLELVDIAADAFPEFLNFVYSGGQDLSLTSKNCTPLLYLADYMDVEQLRLRTQQFIRKDLCLDNADTYYSHGLALGQDRVCQRVEELLANVLMVSTTTTTTTSQDDDTTTTTTPLPSPDAKIWDLLTLESMMEVVGSEKLVTKTLSEPTPYFNFIELQVPKTTGYHLSKIVTKFLQNKEANNEDGIIISKDDFKILTNQDYLPVVDLACVQPLIEMERRLLLVGGSSESGVVVSGAVSSTVEKNDNEKTTNLKKRCFASIRDQCSTIQSLDHDAIQFLRNEPSGGVSEIVDLLFRCVLDARSSSGGSNRRSSTRVRVVRDS